MAKKIEELEEEEQKTVVTRETDADIEDVDDAEESEEESGRKGGRGNIETGSYAAHLKTAKLGMHDFKIWPTLTHALLGMAAPNEYHRVDLRDKEMIAKLEKDLDTKVDQEYLDAEIVRKPWLLNPRGMKPQVDKTKDENGKPLSKKALKAVAKKDKFQAKIDAVKSKIKKIKNKNGPRVEKLKATLDELITKRDRVL